MVEKTQWKLLRKIIQNQLHAMTKKESQYYYPRNCIDDCA
ncbi:hypothetical protein SynSYN20_00722 [Synechococcus sp. SYN20]|nr:hypothetical protein SynSYN20_00722 [Synechococcus sp. SYN20]